MCCLDACLCPLTNTTAFEPPLHIASLLIPRWPVRILQAGESPAQAQCVGRAASSGGDANAKRSQSADFPACPYTHIQLVRLTQLAGPCLGALGYHVPPQCARVLSGEVAGGTDAMPVADLVSP